MRFTLGRVENFLGIEGNAGYQHFSFSHNVFRSFLFQTCLKSGLCGKEVRRIIAQNYFEINIQFLVQENLNASTNERMHTLKYTTVISRKTISRSLQDRSTKTNFNFWVNPFPNKPWFLRVCITSLLKTLWEKEKLLVTSNFSFSHCIFYLSEELSAIYIKFWNCRLQTLSVWKSLKFVVW